MNSALQTVSTLSSVKAAQAVNVHRRVPLSNRLEKSLGILKLESPRERGVTKGALRPNILKQLS